MCECVCVYTIKHVNTHFFSFTDDVCEVWGKYRNDRNKKIKEL